MNNQLKTSLIALSLACLPQFAAAHIHYVDLMGTDPIWNAFGNSVNNSDGSITYNFRGSVNGNTAWADAADEDWGDSHSVLPWQKFEITDDNGAYVTISVSGGIQGYLQEWNEELQDMRPVIQGKEDLTPAFTLYQGLLPILAHDSSEVLPPPEGKEGRWNALGDVTMANDDGEIGTAEYLGHAGDIDSNSTIVALNNIFLPKGIYSMAIGGACSACKLPILTDEIANDPILWEAYLAQENDSFIPRGYNLALTVKPVPLPSAFWFMASSIFGIFSYTRSRELS